MNRHETDIHMIKRRVVHAAGKCLAKANRTGDRDRPDLFLAHQLLRDALVILDRVHERAKTGDY